MSRYWKEKALAENPFSKILGKNCAPLPIISSSKSSISFLFLICFDREEQIKNKEEIRVKKKK